MLVAIVIWTSSSYVYKTLLVLIEGNIWRGAYRVGEKTVRGEGRAQETITLEALGRGSGNREEGALSVSCLLL